MGRLSPICEEVKEVIELSPSGLEALASQRNECDCTVGLTELEHEVISKVENVLDAVELRQTNREHQQDQVDENVRVPPDCVEGDDAKTLEKLVHCAVLSSEDLGKLWCENERRGLPLDPELLQELRQSISMRSGRGGSSEEGGCL